MRELFTRNQIIDQQKFLIEKIETIFFAWWDQNKQHLPKDLTQELLIKLINLKCYQILPVCILQEQNQQLAEANIRAIILFAQNRNQYRITAIDSSDLRLWQQSLELNESYSQDVVLAQVLASPRTQADKLNYNYILTDLTKSADFDFGNYESQTLLNELNFSGDYNEDLSALINQLWFSLKEIITAEYQAISDSFLQQLNIQTYNCLKTDFPQIKLSEISIRFYNKTLQTQVSNSEVQLDGIISHKGSVIDHEILTTKLLPYFFNGDTVDNNRLAAFREFPVLFDFLLQNSLQILYNFEAYHHGENNYIQRETSLAEAIDLRDQKSIHKILRKIFGVEKIAQLRNIPPTQHTSLSNLDIVYLLQNNYFKKDFLPQLYVRKPKSNYILINKDAALTFPLLLSICYEIVRDICNVNALQPKDLSNKRNIPKQFKQILQTLINNSLIKKSGDKWGRIYDCLIAYSQTHLLNSLKINEMLTELFDAFMLAPTIRLIKTLGPETMSNIDSSIWKYLRIRYFLDFCVQIFAELDVVKLIKMAKNRLRKDQQIDSHRVCKSAVWDRHMEITQIPAKLIGESNWHIAEITSTKQISKLKTSLSHAFYTTANQARNGTRLCFAIFRSSSLVSFIEFDIVPTTLATPENIIQLSNNPSYGLKLHEHRVNNDSRFRQKCALIESWFVNEMIPQLELNLNDISKTSINLANPLNLSNHSKDPLIEFQEAIKAILAASDKFIQTSKDFIKKFNIEQDLSIILVCKMSKHNLLNSPAHAELNNLLGYILKIENKTQCSLALELAIKKNASLEGWLYNDDQLISPNGTVFTDLPEHSINFMLAYKYNIDLQHIEKLTNQNLLLKYLEAHIISPLQIKKMNKKMAGNLTADRDEIIGDEGLFELNLPYNILLEHLGDGRSNGQDKGPITANILFTALKDLNNLEKLIALAHAGNSIANNKGYKDKALYIRKNSGPLSYKLGLFFTPRTDITMTHTREDEYKCIKEYFLIYLYKVLQDQQIPIGDRQFIRHWARNSAFAKFDPSFYEERRVDQTELYESIEGMALGGI